MSNNIHTMETRYKRSLRKPIMCDSCTQTMLSIHPDEPLFINKRKATTDEDSEYIITENTSSDILTELYNLSGKLVYTGNKRIIPVSQLPSGIYLLKLNQLNKQELIKVVIQ